MAWRIAALALPSGGPGVLDLLLSGVGLVYVATGLVVALRIPGTSARLFAAFCLCSGLHWGGPLELGHEPSRRALLYLYVLVSGILGQAVFLELGLRFPRATRLGASGVWRRGLYAPVAIGLVLAVVAWGAAEGTELRQSASGLFLLVHSLVSNLYPAAVLGLYLAWLVKSAVGRFEKAWLSTMIGGMLLAWTPYLIASALGLETDPWNLTMVALPLAFAGALFALSRQRQGGEAS